MTEEQPVSVWRCYSVTGSMLLVMIGLSVRLAHFHFWVPDVNRQELRNHRTVVRHSLVRRGVIRDRNGARNILAMDINMKDVCADPYIIHKRSGVHDVSMMLGGILEMEPNTILERLKNPSRRFAYVHRFVEESVASRVKAFGFEGVFFQESSVRRYPQDSLMCHVLGFANYAGYGGAGVELSMDRYLRGSPGEIVTEVDGLRHDRYLRRTMAVPARDGAHVELTLDQTVQYFTEEALGNAVKEHFARAGCAIVMRVQTGEILAMASYPAFNLNEFTTADRNAMLNRAIASVYEPGSTMKALVIASAMNEGLVSDTTPIDCEDGAWSHHGRILRDHGHRYGTIPVSDVLRKSSNIGAAKISLMLGPQKFYDYMRRFGLGKPLNLDLPGEEAGILHHVDRWTGISCSRIAIGQGVAVTPLQMLSIYNTIANEGRMMKPRVVRRVLGREGNVVLENKAEVLATPINPHVSHTMRELLARVTEEGGTGKRARIDGMRVAGKTGTAQKPENGGYSDTNYMASFVGFVPAESPELSLIVVIDEPQPRHSGGYVAAPVFKLIAEQAIRYLHLPASPYQVVSRM